MYTITFDRIRQQPSSQAEMALTIFTWVYLGKRILQVYELQHALAVQAGDTALVEDGIPPEETLLECCLGLVVIERETSTIRFAHFTLQEYLDQHWRELFPSGHSTVASTCLTYLNFEHPHLSIRN
jgi:membrane-associated phospholipid phosphatase